MIVFFVIVVSLNGYGGTASMAFELAMLNEKVSHSH
jgi:hypothetical protein